MKERWTFTPFEDVCVSMTKGPFGSDIKKSLYVPKSADTYKVYIQVNAIEKDASLGEYYISKEYFDSKMFRFEVKPNDYIITCDGTLGRYLRLPPTMERGIISASLLRITLKTSILPKFFEYLWGGYIMSRLTSDIRNSALVHLPSATKIGKVLIPLPSIAEQERIVAELDLLQGVIDKQKAQLKELDTLTQSVFYDMFGDPVENEKGWEVNKLGDVLRTTSGGTPSKEHPEYYENGTIPWVNSGDLHQMYIYDVPKHITQLGVDNSSAKLFPVDTVLVAMYGATVGETSILKIESTTNQAVCGIFPSKHYLPTFLYCVLKYSQAFFIDRASGGAQPNISQGIIKGFNLISPSMTEQQSFATKIEAIEHQKASINASIAETQKLFDYKMDKYFG